jgi:hypothetical protein
MKIKSFNPSEWVRVGTAARIAGVGESWMRQMAKTGKVEAVEIDGLFFIRRRSAEGFTRDPAGRGRPRAE